QLIDQQRYAAAAGANSAFVPGPAPTTEPTVVEPEGSGAAGRSLRSLIVWLPLGLAYAAAAPFPWAAHRAIERLTIPEMLLWYLAIALALVGLAVHWRAWPRYIHILGYLAGILLIFGISQGNLGTLVRQRGML